MRVNTEHFPNTHEFSTSFPQAMQNVAAKCCICNFFFNYVMKIVWLSIDGYREGFWASRGEGGLDNIKVAFCQIFLDFFLKILCNKSTHKKYFYFLSNN